MTEGKLLSTLEAYGVSHVKLNEPMAKHTTWRIGGVADVFVTPDTVEEIQGALLAAKELNLPWTVIGKGSNLLVQDGGIRGIVLKMGDNFAQITVTDNQLVAQSGRSFVSAALIAVKNNLAGLEFATGIPGSVGGAVMMNAGAHGGEVKDVLEWADVIDSDGEIHRLQNADLHFGYRYSILKDKTMLVLLASFRLMEADGDVLTRKVKEWSQRRNSTQPLSLPNCGSVFRNPDGHFAAQLIESAGLKGLRRGGAQISEKHANFIVNLGQATADDVLWLMQHAKLTIREKFGVELETEVRIIGEPASGR